MAWAWYPGPQKRRRRKVSYYGYHQRIKQRISAVELVDHYFTDNYPGIGEALVLVFSTPPFLRPIRPHRWAD